MVAPLPEGWKAYRDPATNAIYYTAPDGRTQWQAPPPPAPTQEMPSLGQLAQQLDALGRQVQALCNQVEGLLQRVRLQYEKTQATTQEGLSKQVARIRAPDHAEGGRSDAGPSKPVKRERSQDEPRAPEHQHRAQGGAQSERRDGEPSEEPIGESVEASDMRLARVMHDKDIHADLRQERKRPRRYGYDE